MLPYFALDEFYEYLMDISALLMNARSSMRCARLLTLKVRAKPG